MRHVHGLRGQRGQSTVEFAVVTAAFLAVVVGLGAIASYLGQGQLVQQASDHAAYEIEAAEQAVRRVLLY